MIDKNLKPIVIDGKQYYYKVQYYDADGYSWEYTYFYTTNNKTKKVNRYYFFGGKVEKLDNKVAFNVNFDIESCSYTRKFVRKEVIKAMEEYNDLKNRCEEIKNGNII